ncbi:peptidyl-prolyl cis-trans isomerase [Bacillus testis]|uniref:peptidyl-prolyl cis-trans isomerase n=1 Tax=Bacillus testis TaxID=1622072 RepID=UPI00067EAE86|nr:peptidyl-prolyl cis-trans isomerase [Bacillus testis]
MSKKQLLAIIALLMIANLVTLLLTTKPFSSNLGDSANEEVATVGKTKITREQLWRELERRYGKETLTQLVNHEVVSQTAEELDVTVSDRELKTELIFIKTLYGSYDQKAAQNEKEWEKQIKNNILLQKLLVKDVKVSEDKVRQTYDQNLQDYKVPTTYHLAHIVVDTKKEAKQIEKELKEGASFGALASEKSTDEHSASLRGDIGYLTKKQTHYDEKYIQKAAQLKKGEYSKPFKVDGGYSILYLHEKIKGKQYPFKEVKSMIARQLALAEMPGALTAEYFWHERDVKWKY